MERIAVFGGTFDPPQTEHINIAKVAVQELRLDKLIIMPAFIPPHKTENEITPFKDRENMCKLAFSQIPKTEVSDYEKLQGGNSYTYLTMQYLKDKYKDAQLYFIVGTDMFSTFHQWKNPQEILKNCKLAYFERDGEKDLEKKEEEFNRRFKDAYVKLSYKGKDVSSTLIRVKCKLGLDVSNYTNNLVIDYIKDNGLYKEDKYYSYVRTCLTQKRLNHTAGVIVTALKLCKKIGVDPIKAELSALLHDVAKYQDVKDFPFFVLPKDTVENCQHQYLGEYIARSVLGVQDEDVLNAIKYHTTAREEMSDLEKLIYLSDIIEPSRSFDGVEEIRKVTEEDFNEGFKYALKEIFKYLKSQDLPIDKNTAKAVKYYCKEDFI